MAAVCIQKRFYFYDLEASSWEGGRRAQRVDEKAVQRFPVYRINPALSPRPHVAIYFYPERCLREAAIPIGRDHPAFNAVGTVAFRLALHSDVSARTFRHFARVEVFGRWDGIAGIIPTVEAATAFDDPHLEVVEQRRMAFLRRRQKR